MDWTARIDVYCERAGPGFWAEPLNAITNAAFLIAAFAVWRMARARGRRDPALAVLIGVLTAIGVGSFLFHTFATRWAGLADVLPILAFILIYIGVATRRFFAAPLWAALAAPVAYVGGMAGFLALWSALLPNVDASQAYLPTLLTMALFAALLAGRGHPAWRGLAAAAALLTLSLTFRTLDDAVCAAAAIGTHFLWHLLNGTLLGVVLATLLRHGPPGASQPKTPRP